MTFANEMKDFVTAFGATSQILGTRSSREKDRLDNEYRRATIDWTKAKTAELTYSPFETYTYPGGAYPGAPGAETAVPADTGDTGVAAPGTTVTTKGGAPNQPGGTFGSFLTGAGPGAFTTDLKPRPRPATHTTPTIAPAVADDDVVTPKAEAISGAAPESFPTGMAPRGTGGRPAHAFGSVQERIKDRTGGIGSLQPAAQRVLSAMDARAQQLGVQLVLTAGAGPGHLSHAKGFDFDIVGYQNGKLWNSKTMTQILAAGGSVGANRFGMYPGGSAHVGIAGSGRPSAMWGAGGLVRGEASRQYTDPYQRALYDAFRNGKLYGSGGQASFEAAQGNQLYGDPRQRVRDAIAWIESRGSGDYSAINKGSGALGRYQVMPKFLPEFSQKALGRVISPQEFLANPELQDQIFDSHFGSLFEKYGNLSDAAAAWYTGGPLASNPQANRYVAQFNQQLGMAGSAGPGPGAGPPVRDGGTAATGAVDEFVPEYPVDTAAKDDALSQNIPGEEPTYSESRNKDDVAANDPRIHTVVKGDTLWDLANENNLDSFMRIVEANPGIVENPDLIYPGEQFVIPPVGAVGESPPNPRSRPVTSESYTPFEQEDAPAGLRYHPRPAERNPATSSTTDTMMPAEHYTPFFNPGGPITARPGEPSGMPPREAEIEYRKALARREEISNSDMDPMAKAVRIRAINVKIAQLEQEMGVGGEAGRAPFPTQDYDPNNYDEQYTPFTNPGGPITARPGEAGALPAEDNPGGPLEARPMPGGPGAIPEAPYVPGEESYTPTTGVDVDQALKQAYARRDQLAGSDMDPMAKAVRIRAINARIAKLEMQRGGKIGAEGAVGPTGETGAVGEDIAVPNAEPISGTNIDAAADVPRPPARPERGPVNPEDNTGVEAAISGGGGTDVQQGGARRDRLGPAQQSIAAVSDFYNQGWNIDEEGHVVRPDGRKAPDDTYKSGKHAVRNGMDWLMDTFFPNANGGGVGDEVDDPNDPSDDANAEAYLSGKGAAKKSDMAYVRGAVAKWAKSQGITLSEEELTMRSLGAMSDFWTMQGEPQKARAVAGSMLQYERILNGQFSAIAKAALEHGDLDKAAEAAVEAYAHIPDGRDINVTGDATTGYTVTYTNAETGKRIAKKVMSPQEMTGMIMNMDPGDVDKFLVKAAGEEEIPDASPQLEKLLSDLEDTPPGQRPVWDARGAAGLDANEQTILHNAHIQALAIWTEQTGGVEAQKEAADVALIFGPDGVTPAAPGTPAATAPAAPGVPAATAPAAPGVPAATAPAAPGTPAATAPAAPGTPAATAPAAPGVPAEPAGAVGDDTLAGGDTATAPAEPAYPEGVYPPGDDMTFGLGAPPRRDLPMYAQLETTKGFKLADAKFEQDTQDYEREKALRQTKWNNYRMNPTSPAEVKPAAVDAGAPDVQGGWLGDEGALVRLQQQFPYLDKALQSPLPPGPTEGRGGYGMVAKSELEVDPNASYNQSTENKELLDKQSAIDKAQWDEEHARREQAFKDELAKITPVKRTLSKNESESIPEEVTKFIGKPGPTPEEVTHLTDQQYLIGDAARIVAEANGLSVPSAVKYVSEMILANPAMPSLPDWRAWQHPGNPGVMLVQPVNPSGPTGTVLHMPMTVFEPLSRAWKEDSDRAIASASVTAEDAKKPGFWSSITGALEGIELPGHVTPAPDTGKTWNDIPGDLGDWMRRIAGPPVKVPWDRLLGTPEPPKEGP